MVTTGEADFFASSERNADFFWIYYGWDGRAAEMRGIELNYISLIEVEPILDYYTPILATSEALINEDPELVERFMKATTKGYEFAMNSPEEAANILLDNAPELDSELVTASQKWLADQYQADAETWGLQKQEFWQNYAGWLYEQGLVDDMLDVEQAYTNDFIN